MKLIKSSILCTEGNPIWFSSSLATGFPTLKSDWSKEFLNSHTFRFMAENGTVLLPIIRRDVRSEFTQRRQLRKSDLVGLTFFLQYPVIERQTLPKKIQANGEDQVEVKLCPVATWIGSSSDFSDPMNSGIPVIGIVCRDERIVKILQDQCVSGNWSISQLSGCPGRIFVDLFIMLSQWSKVWRWARHELAVRDAQLHGEKASMDILTQTRALHRHTANVIAMREELRLHIAAFGKLLVLLNAPENRSLKELFGKEHEARELYEKLEECWVNLSHHQESSAVIIRQLENLLSLVSPNFTYIPC